MPLRRLHHNLLRTHVQTPSSPLKSAIDPGSSKEPDFFNDIDRLQNWAVNSLGSRSQDADSESLGAESSRRAREYGADGNKSKLLVCHDFKGGYTENPFERGYSFEFWHLVDTMIYFSHNRVTIPPRGWLDAGRRHGVKVLGTVIFEWAESKPDLQKCLYGELLDDVPQLPFTTDASLPFNFSTKYASYLISLAQVRKFDGYLLNVETDLNFIPPVSSYHGKTQAERDEDIQFLKQETTLAGLGALVSPDVKLKRAQRMQKNVNALVGWVGWLREEGKRRIGPQWEVIWYDSVTTTGHLEWQDALTPANAPFFMNSDAIFTNYTWARPPDPVPPGAFQEPSPKHFEHHPALLRSANMAKILSRATSDIYIGIDVFGRNCYGGFAVGSSLDMIFPTSRSRGLGFQTETEKDSQDLTLSVALFAPGWTWEREKDGGGERTWEEWWEDELQFWFGRTTEPIMRLAKPFSPAVAAFFGSRERCLLHTPPDLVSSSTVISTSSENLSVGSGTTFYTNFNRGSGTSWWSQGKRVYNALDAKDSIERRGWTDIGSCFPKPDRIWVQPRLYLLKDGIMGHKLEVMEEVDVKTTLIEHDVWEGGTSLEIELGSLQRRPGGSPDSAALLRHVVLPLCTLHACHLPPSGSITLEIIAKNTALSSNFWSTGHQPLRPCLLWATSEPHGREEYYATVMEFTAGEIHELANGWHRIIVASRLSPQSVPSESVPVFALEISRSLFHSEAGEPIDFEKLIVGAISFGPSVQTPPVSSTNPYDAALSQSLVSELQPAPSLSSHKLDWKPASCPADAPPDTLWGILTWKPPKWSTSIEQGYYNVFASAKSPETDWADTPASGRVWLGTSTYELDPNSFVVAGLDISEVDGVAKDSGTRVYASSPLGSPAHIYFMIEPVGCRLNSTSSSEGKVWYTCKVEYHT